jgi:hypothetical protein
MDLAIIMGLDPPMAEPRRSIIGRWVALSATHMLNQYRLGDPVEIVMIESGPGPVGINDDVAAGI